MKNRQSPSAWAREFVKDRIEKGGPIVELHPVAAAVEKYNKTKDKKDLCVAYEAIIPLTAEASPERLECRRKIMKLRNCFDTQHRGEYAEKFLKEYCAVEAKTPSLMSRKARRDFVHMRRSADTEFAKTIKSARTASLRQRMVAATCSKLGMIPSVVVEATIEFFEPLGWSMGLFERTVDKTSKKIADKMGLGPR